MLTIHNNNVKSHSDVEHCSTIFVELRLVIRSIAFLALECSLFGNFCRLIVLKMSITNR